MPEDLRAQRLRTAYERLAEDERLRSNLTDEEARPLFAWARAQLASAAQSAPESRAPGQMDEMETAFHQVRTTLREINSLASEKGKLADGQMEQRLSGILSPYGAPDGALSVGLLERIRTLVRQRNQLSGAEFAARLSQLLQQVVQEQKDKLALSTLPAKKGALDLPKILLFGLAALLLTGCLAGAGGLYWWRTRATPLPPTPTSVAVIPPTATAAATATVNVSPPPGTKTAAPTVSATRATTATRPPAAAGWYQLYFTAPKYPDRPVDHVGGLDEKLTALIASAQKSVDMAVLLLDLDNVTQALVDAHKRGCTVRVVTDVDELNDASFKKLQQAGITVVGGNPDAIMHNKFVVVDGKAVWTGSWNFDVTETYRNNNNGLLIQSVELARNYTAAFEKMWRDRKFGGAKKAGGTTPKLTINGVSVENYFSPEDDIARGGSSILNWGPEGDLHPLLLATLDDLRARGMSPTHVLFHQGEADCAIGLPAEAYKTVLDATIEGIRSRTGEGCDIFVSRASLFMDPGCGDRRDPRCYKACPAVIAAQTETADPARRIFSGPNTDLLVPWFDRNDGYHFTAQAADRFAAAWMPLLARSDAPAHTLQ